MATFNIEFTEADVAKWRESGNEFIGKLLKDKGDTLLQVAMGIGLISPTTAAGLAKDLVQYASRPKPTKAP